MKSTSLSIISVLAVALPLWAEEPSAAPATGKQQSEKIEKQITISVKADYLLYLPKDYGKDPAKKWPVIVFLHGSGERGTDVNLVKLHGPPKVAEKKELPFIVVSPQCPPNEWWQPRVVMTLLDEVLAKYQSDPDRVYLTGLSMGGFGTWSTAQEFPDRFAAIAPVCGGGNPYLGRRLKNVPTWIFHGQKDQSVPVQASIDMNASLKQVGGDVKLTVYPDLGHDCWTV